MKMDIDYFLEIFEESFDFFSNFPDHDFANYSFNIMLTYIGFRPSFYIQPFEVDYIGHKTLIKFLHKIGIYETKIKGIFTTKSRLKSINKKINKMKNENKEIVIGKIIGYLCPRILSNKSEDSEEYNYAINVKYGKKKYYIFNFLCQSLVHEKELKKSIRKYNTILKKLPFPHKFTISYHIDTVYSLKFILKKINELDEYLDDDNFVSELLNHLGQGYWDLFVYLHNKNKIDIFDDDFREMLIFLLHYESTIRSYESYADIEDIKCQILSNYQFSRYIIKKYFGLDVSDKDYDESLKESLLLSFSPKSKDQEECDTDEFFIGLNSLFLRSDKYEYILNYLYNNNWKLFAYLHDNDLIDIFDNKFRKMLIFLLRYETSISLYYEFCSEDELEQLIIRNYDFSRHLAKKYFGINISDKDYEELVEELKY